MIDEVIGGISQKLAAFFQDEAGNPYPIYWETDMTSMTDVQKPCFFIALCAPTASLSPSCLPQRAERIAKLGGRSLQRYPLDVQYYPVAEGDNKDMYAKGDALMDVLAAITLSAETSTENDATGEAGTIDSCVLRGTSRSFEVMGGALHFYVSYNMILAEQTLDNTSMETVEINQRVK